LFSLLYNYYVYALLLSPIDGPKEQQGGVRECIGHTNKRVIGVNSGILSQQTPPPDITVSIYMHDTIAGERDDFSAEGWGGAGKGDGGQRLDLGPIFIPMQVAR